MTESLKTVHLAQRFDEIVLDMDGHKVVDAWVCFVFGDSILVYLDGVTSVIAKSLYSQVDKEG
jgi:hypothetical protein